MHQIVCIHIMVPQQRWKNTYLEITYTPEGGGNVANFCLQNEKLTATKKRQQELEFLSSFKECSFKLFKGVEIFVHLSISGVSLHMVRPIYGNTI